ncbi:MAG TPA: two-component regulator propeller domain-containing protein [Chitinophagales bacterium]|nr:two-component regulator propeller domain-containing protein [Chitinophagales bacterium]
MLTALATPAKAQKFPDLHFENIYTTDGLSDNSVTCLMEDSQGFLWIGTSNGLNRYDGNTFDVFFHEEGNTNSLSGNIISGIIEDNTGVIWIGTRDGGITRYDPQAKLSQRFTRFTHVPDDPKSIYSNRIITLAELNDTYIIFSTEGISSGFIDRKTYQITYHNISDTLSAITDPRTALPTPDGNSWVQRFQRVGSQIYLSRLIGGYAEVYDIEHPKRRKLKSSGSAGSVQCFAIDDDRIWVGGWVPGLYVHPHPSSVPDGSILPVSKIVDVPSEVMSIISWDAQYMLAASKGSGLYIVDKSTHAAKAFTYDRADPYSIAGNKIYCLLKDSRGILWVGTSNGLSKYHAGHWQFNPQLISTDFGQEITHFSMYEFHADKFGINTDQGMYVYTPSTASIALHTFSFQGHSLNPTSVFRVDADKTYLTTESNIYHLDTSDLSIDILTPGMFCNPAKDTCWIEKVHRLESYQFYKVLLDTLEDHPLHIFCSIGSGVGIYDDAEHVYYDIIQYTNVPGTLSNNFVRDIYRDRSGNIWVATSEGLNKWNKSMPVKNTFTIFKYHAQDPHSISHNNVSAIWQAPDGMLWLTTSNGLNAFDGKRFTRYYGNSNQFRQMYGIYPDKKGNIWIPTRDGFEVFDLSKKTFRHVSMINPAWALKSPTRMLQTSSGTWMYGVGNYLISFTPDTYVFDTTFPKLYIKELSVDDKHLFEELNMDALALRHNEDVISIVFSCLQLTHPGTAKYMYKLVGQADSWIELGNNNAINFLDLSPGTYTLYIKVTNPQGDWSGPVKMLQFTVLPAFWQTWWFYLLCTLSILGIGWAVVRYRELQLKRVLLMRNKIANDLHDDVGSALSTINIFGEVAAKKSADNPELRSIIDKITDISTEMQENMTNIVWSLQPRNDNFDQMMLRIKSYALEHLAIQQIDVHFSIDERLSGLKIAANKRKEMFLIYKEALNNILKYASATTVHISFKRNGADVVMEITDNGKGFDPEELHAGNGMFTMRERAALIDGQLHIRSASGKGTSVILQCKC